MRGGMYPGAKLCRTRADLKTGPLGHAVVVPAGALCQAVPSLVLTRLAGRPAYNLLPAPRCNGTWTMLAAVRARDYGCPALADQLEFEPKEMQCSDTPNAT